LGFLLLPLSFAQPEQPPPEEPTKILEELNALDEEEYSLSVEEYGAEPEGVKAEVTATGLFFETSSFKLRHTTVPLIPVTKEWELASQEISWLMEEYGAEPEAEPESFPYVAIPGEEYSLSVKVEAEEEIEKVEVYQVPEEGGEPTLIATITPSPDNPKRVEATNIPFKSIEAWLKVVLREAKEKVKRYLLAELEGIRITCVCTPPKWVGYSWEPLGVYDVPTCEVVEVGGVKCCKEIPPAFPKEERKRVKVVEILERPPIRELKEFLKYFGDVEKLLGRIRIEYPTDPRQCRPCPADHVLPEIRMEKCDEDVEEEVVATPSLNNPPPPRCLHNHWSVGMVVVEFANECKLKAEALIKLFFIIHVTPEIGTVPFGGWRWKVRRISGSGWISEPCPYPPCEQVSQPPPGKGGECKCGG